MTRMFSVHHRATSAQHPRRIAVALIGCLLGCGSEESTSKPTPSGSNQTTGANPAATPGDAAAPTGDDTEVAAPIPAAPLTLTPLVAQTLAPSDAPQTVSYQDQVKVTIPGGLLKQPRKLTISSITDPPAPNHEGLAQAAVYDISIDGLSELDQEITIELPYAPTGMEDRYPVAALTWVEYFEPSMAVWFEVPSTVDLERKTVTAHTRHLSPYAVLNPQGGGDFRLWVAEEKPREALFAFYYNDRTIRSKTLAFHDQELAMALKSLDNATVPGYVAKLAEYAYAARASYQKYGLDLWVKPLRIYVDTSEEIPDSYHNDWTGRIGVNTSALTLDTLQYVIAHEMFHSVQHNFYWPSAFPFRRGWMEATAEYAACRVVMPSYRYMGKLDMQQRRKVMATYLTKELTYFPAHPWLKGAWAGHEYAAAIFLDYLCHVGAAAKGIPEPDYFAAMFKAAVAGGDWAGVDAFVIAQHAGKESLASRYADFAAWYLTAPASPLYFKGDETSSFYRTAGPVDPRAVDKTLSLAEGGAGELYSFSFDEKLTAHAIKATVESPKGKNWYAKVEAPDIPNDVFVTVCRLKKDDRSQGVVTYRLATPGPKRPAIYRLDQGDGLYVVASSARASTMVVVKVTAVPPQPQGSVKNVIMVMPNGQPMYGLDLAAGLDDSMALVTDEITLHLRPYFTPASGDSVPEALSVDYRIYLDDTLIKAGALDLEPTSDGKHAKGDDDVNIGRLAKGNHTIRLVLDPDLVITDPATPDPDRDRIIDHPIRVADSYL